MIDASVRHVTAPEHVARAVSAGGAEADRESRHELHAPSPQEGWREADGYAPYLQLSPDDMIGARSLSAAPSELDAEAERASRPEPEPPTQATPRADSGSDSQPADLRTHVQSSWNAVAERYRVSVGAASAQIGPHVLDRARLRPGDLFLDICCGPGFLAGAADAFGAETTAIDFAPAMIAAGRARFPHVDFRIGDAEAMDVRAEAFDVVASTFGLTQTASPARALKEAYRALKPGGRLLLAHWAGADKSPIARAVDHAISTHAAPAPDSDQSIDFADVEIARAAIEKAGFAEVDVEIVEARLSTPPSALLDAARMLSARTGLLIDRQPSEIRARIAATLEADLAAYLVEDRLEAPAPALLFSARKPAESAADAPTAENALETASGTASETASQAEPPKQFPVDRLWASAARRKSLGDRPPSRDAAARATAEEASAPTQAAPRPFSDNEGWKFRSNARFMARADARRQRDADAAPEQPMAQDPARPDAGSPESAKAPETAEQRPARRKPAFGLVRRMLDRRDGDAGA